MFRQWKEAKSDRNEIALKTLDFFRRSQPPMFIPDERMTTAMAKLLISTRQWDGLIRQVVIMTDLGHKADQFLFRLLDTVRNKYPRVWKRMEGTITNYLVNVYGYDLSRVPLVVAIRHQCCREFTNVDDRFELAISEGNTVLAREILVESLDRFQNRIVAGGEATENDTKVQFARDQSRSEMIQNCWSMLVRLFREMISEKQYESAMGLLRESSVIQNYDLGIRELISCCDCITIAEQVFAFLEHRNWVSTGTYNCFLEKLLNEKKEVKLSQFIERMTKNGSQPDAQTFRAWLKTVKHSRAEAAIEDLVKELRISASESNTATSSSLLEALLDYCLRRNDTRLASHMLDTINPTKTHAPLIQELIHNNSWRQVSSVYLRQLRRHLMRLSQSSEGHDAAANSAISSMFASGDVHAIMNHLKRLAIESPRALTPRDTDGLLAILSERSMIHEMDEFYSWMQPAVTPTITTYNILLRAYLSVDQTNRAFRVLKRILERNVQPNSRTVDLFAQFYAKTDPSKSLRYMSWFEERGVNLQPFVFKNLVRTLVEHGELFQALHVLEQLKFKGVKNLTPAYSAAIEGAFKKGEVSMAEHLCNELQLICDRSDDNLDPNTLAMLVRGYASVGNVARATKLLLNAKAASGVTPRISIYNTVLYAATEKRAWRTLEDVYVNMIECGRTLDRGTFVWLSTALASWTRKEAVATMVRADETLSEDSQALKRMLARLRSDNPAPVGSNQRAQLLLEAEKIGGLLEVIAAFRDTPKEKRTARVYNVVMSIASAAREYGTIVSVFEEMKGDGVAPDEMTMMFAIEAHARVGKVGEAYELLDGAKGTLRDAMPPQIISALMNHHADRGEWTECMALVQRMHDHSVVPDTVVYTTLMKAYAYAGLFDGCRSVWDTHLRPLKPPHSYDDIAIAVFADACGKFGSPELVMETWKAVKQDDGYRCGPTALGSIVKNLVLAGRCGDAKDVMETEGTRHDAWVVKKVLKRVVVELSRSGRDREVQMWDEWIAERTELNKFKSDN
ncbi:hypothetical protein BJ742DRAFT_796628 [Cladochytrium replicatum]|nr:hypothetical protein BJ742DRAFT_796628 [Cladochytrium replicatum]